jgi:hypothetical protein
VPTGDAVEKRTRVPKDYEAAWRFIAGSAPHGAGPRRDTPEYRARHVSACAELGLLGLNGATAGDSILIVPLTVLFYSIQRFLIHTLTLGAIAG